MFHINMQRRGYCGRLNKKVQMPFSELASCRECPVVEVAGLGEWRGGDVENLIRWEDIDNVILCGHSYGGMVITGVADRIPGRIASLVYIDAYVPEDGDSCWTLTTDAFRSIFIEQIAADGFSCEPPEHLLHRDSRFTAQSFASFCQRIRLSGAAPSVVRRGYAFAEQFEGTPFSSTFERCKTDPQWRVRNFPCGHNIMAAMPQELAQFLLEFSE